MRVGYELLDSGRGAEHPFVYHKLISNKREWNNCFIKYQLQTLDKNISSLVFFRLEFSAIFRDKIVSFHIWTNCRTYDLYREYSAGNQYPEFGI